MLLPIFVTFTDSTFLRTGYVTRNSCRDPATSCGIHDDVIKWKHFPRYWPFVRGIHRSPVNSPHKGQWRRALMFTLICCLNKRLCKQPWGWWFETLLCPLWRHSNECWWKDILVVRCLSGIGLTRCELIFHYSTENTSLLVLTHLIRNWTLGRE